MNSTTRMTAAVALLLLPFILPLGGCASNGPAAYDDAPAPLFEGMGSHTRRTSATDPLAQRYFDQGLVWAFAFNHDEAIRSFEEAARIDQDFAAAWWGVALCHGPHINNAAMPDDRQRAAWAALQNAIARREHALPVEQDLIDALVLRYSPTPVEDRSALDAAYADAMRKVWEAHPNDPDVGTLFAESMMDLRPWNLWQTDGAPQPGTEEILAALERVLAMDPYHPGANHLYIHVCEASPSPERAIPSADRLRTAVPIAGHLVHMPAHIDVRVGEWAQAAASNVDAMAADARYTAASPRPQGFYRGYMAHNAHFLSWASMMEGREQAARDAAREMLDGMPTRWRRDFAAFADPLSSMELDVMTRFGRWDEVLAAAKPPSYLPISVLMWRHARGLAYANTGRPALAQRELRELRKGAARLPEDAVLMINNARTVMRIAEHKLAGEIALAEGRLDEAVSEFRSAVEVEDTLLYMEPPDWILPVRHPLGAALLKAGDAAEAEAVYREDLERWPENGWSLLGLTQALEAQGRDDEADEVRRRFERTWSRADFHPGSSCVCVPKVASR